MPVRPHKINLSPIKREQKASWGSDTDFYRLSAWITLRNAYRTQNPLCEMCLKEGKTVSILGNNGVVDHIKPRLKFPELAYEWTNLMSLCHKHHNQKTAKEK